MRNAFAQELVSLAKDNEEIMLLSGDIGNRLFDDYKNNYIERFLNCGVAEGNMMSMAAGLALSGMKPFVYTITPFVTTRCFEQIRVDVCYHNLPVTIVGVGSGLSYALCGPTHHSCEDIGLLRILPNMTVICPADALEVRAALRAIAGYKGPVYLRLGKKNEPLVYNEVPDFEIGKANLIKDGSDVCILGTGNIMPIAVDAAAELGRKGISTQVMSFHTVKPLDEKLLSKVFSEFKTVVTLEEHSLLGGLGGAVAEWFVDNINHDNSARLIRIGTPNVFMHEAGDQEYARKIFGLDSMSVVKKILEAQCKGGLKK